MALVTTRAPPTAGARAAGRPRARALAMGPGTARLRAGGRPMALGWRDRPPGSLRAPRRMTGAPATGGRSTEPTPPSCAGCPEARGIGLRPRGTDHAGRPGPSWAPTPHPRPGRQRVPRSRCSRRPRSYAVCHTGRCRACGDAGTRPGPPATSACPPGARPGARRPRVARATDANPRATPVGAPSACPPQDPIDATERGRHDQVRMESLDEPEGRPAPWRAIRRTCSSNGHRDIGEGARGLGHGVAAPSPRSPRSLPARAATAPRASHR